MQTIQLEDSEIKNLLQLTQDAISSVTDGDDEDGDKAETLADLERIEDKLLAVSR